MRQEEITAEVTELAAGVEAESGTDTWLTDAKDG
jgi:hypothetical protein